MDRADKTLEELYKQAAAELDTKRLLELIRKISVLIEERRSRRKPNEE